MLKKILALIFQILLNLVDGIFQDLNSFKLGLKIVGLNLIEIIILLHEVTRIIYTLSLFMLQFLLYYLFYLMKIFNNLLIIDININIKLKIVYNIKLKSWKKKRLNDDISFAPIWSTADLFSPWHSLLSYSLITIILSILYLTVYHV